MAETGQEKTESATPKRRQEQRDEGNVARSPDLTAACILLAAVLLLDLFGGRILTGMKVAVQAMLSGVSAVHPVRAGDLGALGAFSGYLVTTALAPFVLTIAAVALVATVGQVGLLITAKPLTPSLSKMNPIKGLANILGGRGAVRLAMSLAKVVVIAWVTIVVIAGQWPQIIALPTLDLRPMMMVVWGLFYSLGLKLAMVLLVLAVLDYAYQKWQRERDMRMTKEEVKEELKRMDGDPLIKQRRTRVARQLAMQRITSAVPRADVVVTNPTHFAIALRYDSQNMNAPKVVAKGADFMALRIRQIAIANGVPLVERKELARSLYQTVEIGQEIPPQFFAAVAEILAYVYRLSGRKTA